MLKRDEILEATGGKVLCGRQETFAGLSIDSRTIRESELFVALRGPHFDGHDFVVDALQAGAGAVVSIPPAEVPRGRTIVHVANTLRALQEIARYRRRALSVPVVGVTGTNGKTTTKELLAQMLGQDGKVLKTRGNLNNHIGMPLCLANMDADETALVLEMGSSGRGEIRQLCEIAQPGYAAVTNVGPAHLEGFGTVEAVRDTDLEILDFVQVAAINADDVLLMEGCANYGGRLVTYGIERPADLTARDIRIGHGCPSFELMIRGTSGGRISLAIPGRVNVYNALAAAAVALEIGVAVDAIRKAAASFGGVPMRFQIREADGVVFLVDAYNANPASMKEAVMELGRMRKGRAIAVLGDMLELGGYSADAHRSVMADLSTAGADILIAVGPEMGSASAAFSGEVFAAPDSVKAGELLAGMLRFGDAVLIKGSRGMRMEKALPRQAAAQEESAHAV